MSNVSAEIKVHPGKELLALDFAEIMDASLINSGIIQGCAITLESGVLKMASGRIMIKGRLGLITGGDIELPTISTEADCKLLAVCDLRADTPFYVRLVSNAEYETLSADADRYQDTFNVGNGVAFVDLGTAHVNPASGVVTRWTPSANAVVKKDAKAYADLSDQVVTGLATIDAAWKSSVTKWVTYIQKRLFSADYFITAEEIVVPACRLTAGESKAFTCPAVRGSTVTATAIDNRTEAIPQIPSYNPSPVDGVPSVADTDPARYVAKAFAGITLSNSTFVPRNASQAVGKNANLCVIRGFTITGSDRLRKGYIYLRNTGTAEAIVDIHVFFMFVRRG